MIKIPNECVEEAYILSTEECRSLPTWILANGDWWWLRSPGDYVVSAAAVEGDGYVDSHGYENLVVLLYGARPALKIKLYFLNPLHLKIGESVEVFGKMAQYIGNGSVLMCECIGKNAFDKNSNDYEKSALKACLEEWFKKEKTDETN